MKESRFVKEVDGLAEYEIIERVKGEGKEYKAEPIMRRKED